MIVGAHKFGNSISDSSNKFQIPSSTVSDFAWNWKGEGVLIYQLRPSKPAKLTDGAVDA